MTTEERHKQAMTQADKTFALSKVLSAHIDPAATYCLIVSYPHGPGANVTFVGNVEKRLVAELLEAVAAGIRKGGDGYKEVKGNGNG
jgi:hypothetical protein